MARANPYKPSGSAGELSPRLYARTDFAKYGAAWETCENVVPLAEGAMMRRAGTRYVHALNDQTKRGRLLPFLFSNTQAYVLAFEDKAVRFNRNQGQILVADTDAAISNGTFDSDITGWTDRSSGGSATIEHQTEQFAGADTLSNSAIAGPLWGDATAGRKHAGFLFFNAAAADVESVTISVSGAATPFTARARVYTDNSGSPGVIVGSQSDSVSINAISLFTFTFSTPPSLSASTNYWIVLSDEGSSGQANLQTCSDQGTGFASGFADTITSIADATNGMDAAWEIRIKVTAAGGAQNGFLALVGDNGQTASAEQSVTTTNTDQEHVLQFRVIGVQSDKIKLRIGRTSEGDQFIDDLELQTGYHSIAFTPDASPFYVQFRNEADKTVHIDDVSLVDNAAFVLMTPYTETDLPSLKWAQSADVMYLSHPNYRPYKLERRGDTTWSLVEVDFEDGPYLDENTDSGMTLAASATSGNGVTITASGFSPFAAGQEGRLVRLRPTGEPGYAVITDVINSENVTADIKRNFGSTSATANWSLGAWSESRGWPSAVTFFEQRAVWAGTAEQPQSFWMTQTADLENMRPDSFVSSAVAIEDDDALDYTISANEVNAIVAMAASDDALVIFTSGGEWRPQSDGAVLTPTDITVRRQTSHGSAENILPLSIDNVVLFVQRGLRKIREFAFSFEADGYRAFDMTRLAQHITFSNIREMSYAEEPDNQVYVVREDGQLLSMTYRREEDVVGWTRHILGGAFSSGDAVVESVTTIPGANGNGQTHDSTNRNEVWLIVKRTIDGSTTRYVEFFERDHEFGFDKEDAFYVDCGLTYDGAAATTITGFGHLEGETLKVWADGEEVADVTVTSGQFTLSTAASVVQAGLGYTHKLKTLKPEAGASAGTAVTKVKKYARMGFVLYQTVKIKYSPDGTTFTEDDFGIAAGGDFFDGEIFVDWESDWLRDPRIHIEGDSPSPFMLLAIAPEIDTKDLY